MPRNINAAASTNESEQESNRSKYSPEPVANVSDSNSDLRRDETEEPDDQNKLPLILRVPDKASSLMQTTLEQSFMPSGNLQRFDITNMSWLVYEVLLAVALLNGIHRQHLNGSVPKERNEQGSSKAGSKSSESKLKVEYAPAAMPFPIAPVEELISDGTDLELLERLFELLRQLRKAVRNFNKRRLDKCKGQIQRIKREVALRPYKNMRLPEPQEIFEEIKHSSELGNDAHFDGPDEPKPCVMPKTCSKEWIDLLGPPALLEQDDPEAYEYLYRSMVSDFSPDIQSELLLVKLLVDLEWLDRRYEAYEMFLLTSAPECSSLGAGKHANTILVGSSDAAALDVFSLDSKSHPAVQERMHQLDQVSKGYIDNKATVVELWQRRGIIASVKDVLIALLRDIEDDKDALTGAKLDHKVAVRRATSKGVF